MRPATKRRAIGVCIVAALVAVCAAFAYATALRAGLLPWHGGSIPGGAVPEVPPGENTPRSSIGDSLPPPAARALLQTEASKTTSVPSRSLGVTIALQPSHQDDTGEGWHEYAICGDITDRTIRAGRGIRWVKAWDISNGLTGSNNYRPRPTNTIAFDREIALANAAGASCFISIHNDGGAPSGILGEHMPGDDLSGRLTEYLVQKLSAELGLPNRGVREVRLYSLEPERNRAKYRSLLEIGDNVADRTFLSSVSNRARIGRVLAAALASFVRKNR